MSEKVARGSRDSNAKLEKEEFAASEASRDWR